jgi:predicted DNA-binding transcriptional regulator YafY
MIEQQKILRVLKLISLLKQQHRKNVQELSSILDISDKSIYRYIKLLEELGFAIDKDTENRYFIQVWDDEADQWAFSSEETGLMQQVINNTLKKHPLRNTILEKINIKSENHHVGNQLYKAGLGKIISQITSAIDQNKQIIIRKYMSANSETISDRLVEPFAFTDDKQHLVAFEVSSGISKHYKIERIGSIVLSEKKQKNKNHILPQTDIFGLNDGEPEQVRVTMTLRAMILLKEEFPKSEPYISKSENNYILSCEVKGFRGIGRFVAGVLNELVKIENDALKTYMRNLLESGKKLF